jgi:hypothetical protein
MQYPVFGHSPEGTMKRLQIGRNAGCVIVSPSLWWDRGVMFTFEEEFRAQGNALAARAFFAAGEKDGRNILRDIGRMEELLGRRQYRGLDYRGREY